MSFLTQLPSISTQGPLLRILAALLILTFGHLAVKLVKLILRKTIKKGKSSTKKEIKKREEKLRLTGNILDAAVITAAIIYLNTGIISQFTTAISTSSPQIFSALLLTTLGVLLIKVTVKILEDFLTTVGVRRYLREIGLSNNATKLISATTKGILYLILIQLVLTQLNLGQTYLSQFFTAATWAAAFLIAALIFYSLKDLVQNIAAGAYLKNSTLVRKGEEVKINEETGEIKDISLFATEVDTETGYTLLTPNQEIMGSPLKFKRTQSDLETLEDITKYFVAQNPSYCGPASMEMALEIFGYQYEQEKIAEKADHSTENGVHEKQLMESAEELTDEEVKTAWIGFDDITDLADEYKSWFNDGALVISNFYKPEIFPEATVGHFVVSVGVEGDEILNLDPNPSNGGVYYVDKDTMEGAMAEFGHKRGYIVLAPKGTTAYWRIKNDLIYADKSIYDELSKTLETRLRKIMRQGRILKNSTPDSMKKYMERWSNEDEEKLTRVWKPEGFTGDKEKLGGEENNESSEDN